MPPLIQPELTSKSTVTEQNHRHRHPHPHHHFPFILITIAIAIALSILIFLAVLYRKLSWKRTTPIYLKPPHRFSYSVLRRATSTFSGSNRLGKGGFGSVYWGTLQFDQEIAVKLIDSGSLQGEREFKNELSLAVKIDSNYIVSLIGFSSDQRHRRMLLVYELMHHRSLQDAILNRKCSELMEWKKRFSIAIDIARGLEFLHYSCDPVVIHGDIKPSNILLDCDFNAKIVDFSLARSKIEETCEVVVGISEIESAVATEDKKIGNGIDKGKKKEGSEVTGGGDANGSIIEETESVMTGFEEVVTNGGGVEASPPEFFFKVTEAETVVVEASPSEIMDRTSVSDGNFDKLSMDRRNEFKHNRGILVKKSEHVLVT